MRLSRVKEVCRGVEDWEPGADADPGAECSIMRKATAPKKEKDNLCKYQHWSRKYIYLHFQAQHTFGPSA